MAAKRPSDLFNIKSRFLRSAHLERDFQDPSALAGYVPTQFIQSCLGRIGGGLKLQSGQRAWRITGDYGSGKSSFALLLAHSLAGHDNSLPPQVRKAVEAAKLGLPPAKYLPVLVTCSRKSLGKSILEALQRSLRSIYKKEGRNVALTKLQKLLEGGAEPPEGEIVNGILEANNQVIADSKAQGLLLIIDELGKFLEFAALQPHSRDVFLLQSLAEAASRSQNEPLFLVCLLHQGFNAYAEQLNQSAQREWEKVAGRFEEIVFSQPAEQVANLIASALNIQVDKIPQERIAAMRRSMQKTIELGWFGSADRDTLVDLAARLTTLRAPTLSRRWRSFSWI